MPGSNKVNTVLIYICNDQRIKNTDAKKLCFTLCLILVLLITGINKLSAQACLPNFDFEKGNFDNWECLSGTIGQDGSLSLSPSGPVYGRHSLIKATADGRYDDYGDFFVNSPNGSTYCVKLGNN